MLFQNGSLIVRRLKELDKHLLAKWLSTPEVLKYYEGRDNPFNLDKVDKVFYASEDDEVKCDIEYGGKSIGYIQYYELDEAAKKEYGYETGRIFGTDQFIGEADYWNRGIGTLLVTSMTEFLFNRMKADKVEWILKCGMSVLSSAMKSVVSIKLNSCQNTNSMKGNSAIVG